MSAIAVDSRAELVEQLDQRVREAVRVQGVDPQRDAPVVRRIAETVVRDHDERSLNGVVAPVPDAAAVVGELVARVSGFGPLQTFLDDPAVEEIWVNDPSAKSGQVRGSSPPQSAGSPQDCGPEPQRLSGRAAAPPQGAAQLPLRPARTEGWRKEYRMGPHR